MLETVILLCFGNLSRTHFTILSVGPF
jgi:hypothetical protein